MRDTIKKLLVGVVVVSSVLGAGTFLTPETALAKPCGATTGFLGFPSWYRGIPTETIENNCVLKFSQADAANNFSSIWTIVVNIIDIFLRIIGIVAVVFIIIGGGRYIISQGDSGAITIAKQTITRAITGLIIAILSVLILNFIAGNVLGLTVDKETYQVEKGQEVKGPN